MKKINQIILDLIYKHFKSIEKYIPKNILYHIEKYDNQNKLNESLNSILHEIEGVNFVSDEDIVKYVRNVKNSYDFRIEDIGRYFNKDILEIYWDCYDNFNKEYVGIVQQNKDNIIVDIEEREIEGLNYLIISFDFLDIVKNYKFSIFISNKYKLYINDCRNKFYENIEDIINESTEHFKLYCEINDNPETDEYD